MLPANTVESMAPRGNDTRLPQDHEPIGSVPRRYESVDAADFRHFQSQRIENSVLAYSRYENTAKRKPGEVPVAYAPEVAALERGIARLEVEAVPAPKREHVARDSMWPGEGETAPEVYGGQKWWPREGEIAPEVYQPETETVYVASDSHSVKDFSRLRRLEAFMASIEALQIENNWTAVESVIRDILVNNTLSLTPPERAKWVVERAFALLVLERWEETRDALDHDPEARSTAKGAYCLAEANLNLGFAHEAARHCERAINLFGGWQGQQEHNLIEMCLELMSRIKDTLGKSDAVQLYETPLHGYYGPGLQGSETNITNRTNTRKLDGSGQLRSVREGLAQQANAHFLSRKFKLILVCEVSDQGLPAYRILGDIQELFRAFKIAIEDGDQLVIDSLLLAEPQKDSVNEHGRTLLHAAVIYCDDSRNSASILQNLIEKGYITNTQDNANWTALDWAVHKNHTEKASVLLESGAISGCIANPDAVTRPVCRAAAMKNLAMLDLLVRRHRHDVTEISPFGSRCALIAAVLPSDWLSHVRGLKEYPSLSDFELDALDNRALNVVRFLLQHGAAAIIDEVDDQEKTALHHAVSLGMVHTVSSLLDAGAGMTIKRTASVQSGMALKTAIFMKRGKRHNAIRKLLNQHEAYRRQYNTKKLSEQAPRDAPYPSVFRQNSS